MSFLSICSDPRTFWLRILVKHLVKLPQALTTVNANRQTRMIYKSSTSELVAHTDCLRLSFAWMSPNAASALRLPMVPMS